MATVVKSFAIQGIDGYPVDIETKMLDGQPMISIIGLGDQAVKEAAERIQAAIDESGYVFPKKRVIISLAPSDKKKSGSHFDLAMAIGVLQQNGDIGAKNIEDYGFIGELSLNGQLRACRGILPMIIAGQKKGIHKIIVPEQNLREAMLVQGVEILGFSCLRDVIAYLEGKISKRTECSKDNTDSGILGYTLDFSEVKGQEDLIEAVVLAAAGGHNMLMIGEPGCGKTMIAQRIPTILPEMTEEECLEVTKIYSISGMLPNGHALIKFRPFRAPHHNASLNALIGGGVNAMPGEVSLAHNGVLFLDELAEFSRRTLDALRQPVEDKKVCISRVNGTHTFPSNFMFVTAMNPCPCGYYNHPTKACVCSPGQVQKYLNKISGPLLDRIDIQIEIVPVPFDKISDQRQGEASSVIRNRVIQARRIQEQRYADHPGIYCNAQMNSKLLSIYARPDDKGLSLLRNAMERLNLSARAYDRILKVARTIADLEGAELIQPSHLAEAISYRNLDRENWAG